VQWAARGATRVQGSPLAAQGSQGSGKQLLLLLLLASAAFPLLQVLRGGMGVGLPLGLWCTLVDGNDLLVPNNVERCSCGVAQIAANHEGGLKEGQRGRGKGGGAIR